jgi:hypothetical protein
VVSVVHDLPIRFSRSTRTETIPPLILTRALFTLPTFQELQLQETRERFSFQQTVAALQGRAKIKAQGVFRPPPVVLTRASNYVVVALRQVYPKSESLFDGGSDKQTFMSLYAALRALSL